MAVHHRRRGVPPLDSPPLDQSDYRGKKRNLNPPLCNPPHGGTVTWPKKHRKHQVPKKSPRREVVRSSAAAGAYTPPFWGSFRSIPQGMIFDVQPRLKSLLCAIRQYPNVFFDSEALSPETRYHFFEGGGKKVCAQKVLGTDPAEVTRGLAPPGGWPTGNRTADLQGCGGLHYHSTIACSDSCCSPHCL